MALYSYNFEDGVSGAPYVIDTPTSGSIVADTANFAHGATSLRADYSGSGQYVQCNLPAASTDVAVRYYVYADAVNTVDSSELRIGSSTTLNDNATTALRMTRNTAGRLRLFGNGTSQIWTATDVLAADTWYRIELRVQCGTSGNAVVSGAYFVGDSTTPVQTFGTSTATTTATVACVRMGKVNNPVINPSTGHMWFDDLAIDDAPGGLIGPYNPDGEPPASVHPLWHIANPVGPVLQPINISTITNAGGGEDPNPPDPGDWATAFATRDINGDITDWYTLNTGHDPALAYQEIAGGLTITDAWLASNNGNGRVWLAGGRWHVERYRTTGTITVNANDVTITNCHVNSTGALYAMRSTTSCTGLIVEHCTFQGNSANPNGATINFPAATEPGQIIFRFTDFSGWRAGIYCFGGVTAEYCYSHDLYFTEGSHNTGASIRARNCTLYRCLITDGNSAAISCYAENTPYTGILIQENVLRLPETDTGPEVIMAKEYTTPQPGETRRLVGNLFYRGFIGGDTFGFTEISGNVDIYGNAVN